MILKPGDLFCVTYETDRDDDPSFLQSVLSFGIRGIECFNDVDGKAQMTHVGIVVSPGGKTFEALWTYRNQNLYRAYAGQPILIGRHRDMNERRFAGAHREIVRKYGGKQYPAWKLPLFALAPRIIKYLPGKPVCSELGLQEWMLAGCQGIDHWRGATPSYVAEVIRHWRHVQVVYDGLMPEK